MHDETGIHGSRFVLPDAPNRPKCFVEGAAGEARAAPASPAAAAPAPAPAPAPVYAPAPAPAPVYAPAPAPVYAPAPAPAPAPAAYPTAYGAGDASYGAPPGAYGAAPGAYGAAPGAYGAPPGAYGAPPGAYGGAYGGAAPGYYAAPMPSPRGLSFSAAVSAVRAASALQQAVPAALPPAWERVMGTDGRTYYRNRVLGTMEAQLPTERTYELEFGEGPLGLDLEANWSGRARLGFPSGRRMSGQEAGAVVRQVVEGYQAHATGRIKPGHHLVAINGSSVLGLSSEQTIHALRSASRPIRLAFEDPYALQSASASYNDTPADTGSYPGSAPPGYPSSGGAPGYPSSGGAPGYPSSGGAPGYP
jgi:hypothetical protein